MCNFDPSMTTKNQIFALFLSVFYLSLSIGFGLRAHYCHEDISSVSYASISLECECSEDALDVSCCTTVEQYFQFDEEIILRNDKSIDLSAKLHEVKNFQLDLIEQETTTFQPTTFLVVDYGPPKYLKHTSLILYA